jgi:thiamine biosynthesis lipoprotein
LEEKQESKELKNILVIVISVIMLVSCVAEPYIKDSGMIFGTTYAITYQHNEDLKSDIEAVMQQVDNSLSPFNKSSVITAINNNTSMEVDENIKKVFTLAKAVSQETDGAFDITVAPLVNAWGFGFKSGIKPTDEQVDSILAFVGQDKVTLQNDKITKADSRIMLDCSAIAKGYGVDMVAEYLTSKGIANYLVEIGGEISASGKNPSGTEWKIGVTKPVDDSLSINQENQTVLQITDQAMATSGNYRNFYYEGGKKYAHTINPHTGKPAQSDILSATVIAPSCAVADAYATAFMVLGSEKAKEILKKHPELKVYFILSDYSIWQSM